MNHTVALIILTIVGPIFGYLCGNILWSVIIGKVFFNNDPRNHESKNAGATNSGRLYGKKVGIIVMILDVLKSYIPTMVMWLITKFLLLPYLKYDNQYVFNECSLVYLTGFFAIVGHCYPAFFRFRGGKGSSCYGGFLLAISPFITIISFILFVGIILIFRYVSLSSILCGILCPLLLFIPGINWLYMINQNISDVSLINNGNLIFSLLFVVGILYVGSGLVIFKHRENIKRLINHNERKINLF